MRRAPRLRRVDPHCPGGPRSKTLRRAPMNANDVASEGLGLISRLADEARSVAVVAGYVALGAAVPVGRSLLDAAGETRRRLSLLGPRPREQETRRHGAA